MADDVSKFAWWREEEDDDDAGKLFKAEAVQVESGGEGVKKGGADGEV